MKTLMIQGTTSDAGKSTLVAALCRIFANDNIIVAPFKPQNMALNSAVTFDGKEIGRAQALQAIAAKVPARVDFNPILLKPNSDTGAQVILHGKAVSNMEAQTYHDYKKVAMDAVLTSHNNLKKEFELLLIEGAGSPAEINLRENDIANMGYAEAVDCPVIIIADIDKGGVFAHLVGTLALLSESEQARVKGFVINRFRGDISLLQSGLDWLEQKTNKPVLGVLPYIHDLALDAEDAISVKNIVKDKKMHVSVLLLPHISNHTDFDCLRLQPNIDLQYIKMGEAIDNTDLIIIPGSKNVISDLLFLKSQKWEQQIKRHLRYGGKLMGVCGGFQMLGHTLLDPFSIESHVKQTEGLNLLDMSTTLTENKSLYQIKADLELNGTVCSVEGYEIHCGKSSGKALDVPLLSYKNHPDGLFFDGCISEDNQIIGTYLHGLFDSKAGCKLILNWVTDSDEFDATIDLNEHRELELEKLADVFKDNLDMASIKNIINTHQNSSI